MNERLLVRVATVRRASTSGEITRANECQLECLL
jgi:hypothetical protein